VNGKTLGDIMRTIEEKDVEIITDQTNNIMTIRTSKDNFDINGIAANEYVALPEIPQENTVTIDIHSFVKGIEKTEYAVTEKNFSPVLT
jgi:DNA polymerase III sliding clamp (beta) subunit (PCNA family)